MRSLESNLTSSDDSLRSKKDPGGAFGEGSSSEKSSVMCRLTGLLFPRGAVIKIVFVTEVIMKRTSDELITVEVVAGDASSPSGIKILQRSRNIAFHQFTEACTTATANLTKRNKSGQKLFDGVLRIAMQGPHCAPLTVIGLPALLQSVDSKVSMKDIDLSAQLINGYVEKSRTLILAVVSAKKEMVNQAITQMAARADPQKRCTMGILTKIDTVKDEDREEELINTLQSREVPLASGWFSLVNIIQGEKNPTTEPIDQAETAFFAQPRFDKTFLGIDAFCRNVTNVVALELINPIPAVEQGARTILLKSNKDLLKLGDPRKETHEQRAFLQSLTADVVRGLKPELEKSSRKSCLPAEAQHITLTRNLRARIDRLKGDWVNAMVHHCSSKAFTGTPERTDAVDGDNVHRNFVQDCRPLRLPDAVAWVAGMQNFVCRFPVPGRVNDEVFGHLFHDLASRWVELSNYHLQLISDKCEHAMVEIVKQHVGEVYANTVDRIRDIWIRPLLNKLCDEAKQTVVALKDSMPNAASSSSGALAESARGLWDVMLAARSAHQQLTLDEFTAIGTLAGVRAYYRAEMEHWVKNVNDQIAHGFLAKVAKDILSETRAMRASEEEVANLVSEPKKSVDQRSKLKKKIERLEHALAEISQHRKVAIKKERSGDE